MNKKLNTLLVTSFLAVAPLAEAAQFCEEIAFRVPVAWEVEKLYRKTCHYETQGSYYNNGSYITYHGAGTISTNWSTTPGSCPASASVLVTYIDNTTNRTSRSDRTAYLSNSTTDTRDGERYAVAWETRIEWRDRNGNQCTPFGGN